MSISQSFTKVGLPACFESFCLKAKLLLRTKQRTFCDPPKRLGKPVNTPSTDFLHFDSNHQYLTCPLAFMGTAWRMGPRIHNRASIHEYHSNVAKKEAVINELFPHRERKQKHPLPSILLKKSIFPGWFAYFKSSSLRTSSISLH